MNSYETDRQVIDLRNIKFIGSVLDIGGGGEGIISRIASNTVVAIDKFREELEETADIGIKIIMDACELKFLDNSFHNITCFYSLMYMKEQEIKKFLQEAYRVLKQGGCLWIWDITIPMPVEADVFIAQLSIKLTDEQFVSTGYGVAWNRSQSLELIQVFGEEAGFILQNNDVNGQSFFLQLRRY